MSIDHHFGICLPSANMGILGPWHHLWLSDSFCGWLQHFSFQKAQPVDPNCVPNETWPKMYCSEIALMSWNYVIEQQKHNMTDHVFLSQFVARCCVSLQGKQEQVLFWLSRCHPGLSKYRSNHRYLWPTESSLWGWLWSVWCWLDRWPNSEVSCSWNNYFSLPSIDVFCTYPGKLMQVLSGFSVIAQVPNHKASEGLLWKPPGKTWC